LGTPTGITLARGDGKIWFLMNNHPLFSVTADAAEVLARHLIDEVRIAHGQEPLATELYNKLLGAELKKNVLILG